jgi:hypothetical protein
VLRLQISEDGAQELLQRLDGSFRLRSGAPVVLPPLADQGAARYFESVERFGVPKLCKHLDGRGPQGRGTTDHASAAPAAQGVILDLRWRAEALASCDRPAR